MTSFDLHALKDSGAIRSLDYHFARRIASLDSTTDEAVSLAAAIVSYRSSEGHSCIPIAAEAGRVFQPDHGNGIRLPSAAEWLRQLEQASAVAVITSSAPPTLPFRPLILDPSGRLYLHKMWVREQQLSRELTRRNRLTERSVDKGRLRDGLDRLFPAPPNASVDWQKVAAASAVLRSLSIISGGPGTGKTTTIVKILALLIEQYAGAPPSIALAAPTGKAAGRLQESIRRQKASLSVTDDVRTFIPDSVSTIHRLLGANQRGTAFRYDAENPLNIDVLVIDEASMIDLTLMHRLFMAVPHHARIILLGDKNQLSSVEAGSILADICFDADGPTEPYHATLAEVMEPGPPPTATPVASMADGLTTLRKSYRFSANQGIAQLADAIKAGDVHLAEQLLQDATFAEIELLSIKQGFARQAAEGYRPLIARAQKPDQSPSDLLSDINEFRCLCALRRGDYGMNGVNIAIEQELRRSRVIPISAKRWYPGRLVMILRNDYALGLFNGDIGLTLPVSNTFQTYRVWFERADGSTASFPPARLPLHETAYAVTVHKSQGSEFRRTLLVLPPEDAPVITRELLYTALTRSRETFTLFATVPLLKTWIQRQVLRHSGLRDALASTRP